MLYIKLVISLCSFLSNLYTYDVFSLVCSYALLMYNMPIGTKIIVFGTHLHAYFPLCQFLCFFSIRFPFYFMSTSNMETMLNLLIRAIVMGGIGYNLLE